MGAFQAVFGPQNLLIIDNNRTEKELVTNTIQTASKYIRRQLNRNPNNYLAKQWIAKELQAKKR